MAVVDDPEAVKPEPEKPKSRKRSARAAAKGRRSRKRTPPNRVDPGWIHESLARFALKLLQRQAPIPVDIGKVDDPEQGDPIPPEDDTVPVDTLARVFAHIGHRLPLVNRFEKRLEGQEKTAGLGSDLMALMVELFRRNEVAISAVATAAVEEQRNQQRQKRAAKEAAQPEPPIRAVPTPEVQQ